MMQDEVASLYVLLKGEESALYHFLNAYQSPVLYIHPASFGDIPTRWAAVPPFHKAGNSPKVSQLSNMEPEFKPKSRDSPGSFLEFSSGQEGFL